MDHGRGREGTEGYGLRAEFNVGTQFIVTSVRMMILIHL
jgi:hypothetical protein